eukprot:781937-Alexandrium_andersonii.AAC.1
MAKLKSSVEPDPRNDDQEMSSTDFAEGRPMPETGTLSPWSENWARNRTATPAHALVTGIKAKRGSGYVKAGLDTLAK